MTVTVAVIGAGADPESVGPDGFSMGYRHADAIESIEECELVGVADIVEENAVAFADAYDLGDEAVFTDVEALVEEVSPELVTVAVPPHVHADVVIACARGGVEAIHCEKPIAASWGDSRLLCQEAARFGVQLTFNHQRRFKPSWELAQELLADGAVGEIERVETYATNLYDWGTHCLDALGFFSGDVPADWVLAGLDYREENVWFGVHNENHATVSWEYENGIHGQAFTGGPWNPLDCRHRIAGTEGELRVDVTDGAGVEVRRFDGDGETHDPAGADAIRLAMADALNAYRSAGTSRLAASNALNATEIIFAAYESVRRRGRVELPLDVGDHPLEAMVADGTLNPTATQ